MLGVRLICSDTDCVGVVEIGVEDLREVAGMTCECECGFVVEGVWEMEWIDRHVQYEHELPRAA